VEKLPTRRLPVPTKEGFTFTMDLHDDESTPFNVRSRQILLQNSKIEPLRKSRES
jgi:hypothetical protein